MKIFITWIDLKRLMLCFFWLILSFLSCKVVDENLLSHMENKGKPNIILFYADDLGWTDLGIYGSDFYQTPHLDRLAGEGMSFTNAYANAANCAPSRACLMTGLYTPRHGIYTVNSSKRGKSENRKLIPSENTLVLDKKFKTIPQSLKEANYKTCIAGKWHLSKNPGDYGFDYNFGGFEKGHPPSYFSPYSNPQLPDGPKGEYLPERLASEVVSWMTENQDDPFFVYFPFYLVHTPIQAKPEIEEKYQNLIPGQHHNKASYAAMVEAMDHSVGKVLNTIRDLNLEQETIILFTSDNGPMGAQSVAKPLRGSKGMMYEGGIRVPFFVKWPGVSISGSTNHTPVIGSDIYPTLLDIVQYGSEKQIFDGVSLISVIQENEELHRPLFWHFPAYLQMTGNNRTIQDSHDKPLFRSAPCSAIRYGDWKLIRYYENEDIELYNLKEDISESINLVHANKEKKEELLHLLNEWLERTNAPIPVELNPEYIEKAR